VRQLGTRPKSNQVYDAHGNRLSVVVVARLADGHVLTGIHKYRGGVEYPAGGVEINETLLTAGLRELYEETGVLVNGVYCIHENFSEYRRQYILYINVTDYTMTRPLCDELRDVKFSLRRASWSGVRDHRVHKCGQAHILTKAAYIPLTAQIHCGPSTSDGSDDCSLDDELTSSLCTVLQNTQLDGGSSGQ
jgi:8-oxo-dGTP pyrophosphatase MutT (NUDIX family)